ncbi:mucin-15 [Ctenodactylus gundi]
MLTLFKIVFFSTLFISLPYESHEEQNLEKFTTRSITEVWTTVQNKSTWLEREANANANTENENRNNFNPKESNFSLLDPFKLTNSTGNVTTRNVSRPPTPTSMFSTSPSFIHGFVSKLPLNSSLSDGNISPVSAHPNSTPTISTENSSWSLVNDTMDFPDNSSTSVSVLPLTPTTASMTPLTMEPTEWLTTDSGDFAGFTPYQEKTTLQPTLKFTNNSKLFPNTADSQKENRNTGVVFGAILGAILGVSLLSLVGYLLCGKRKTDSFSHRRLYDDRNEPVLRLDNAPEPYDINFGNSSYYNPTVSDSSASESRESARDAIPMDDIPSLRTSV